MTTLLIYITSINYFLIIYSLIKQTKTKMALQDQIAQLQADVAAQQSVVSSAVTLITGLKTSLDKAIADLQAAGVTAEQTQALSDLSATLEAETSSLSAAVAANTPPAAPAQ